MHNSYDDIRQLAGSAAPLWYDENGVPRYCRHHPHASPDIYAREVVLLRIACQGCGAKFDVQMTWGPMDLFKLRPDDPAGPHDPATPALANAIRNGQIHYGDPPNAGCCASGPTMNCNDLRVLEYWRQSKSYKWERDTALEIILPDGLAASGQE